jgi:hypothetical protein
MLCFITALKSKSVSNDWIKVSRLFEDSLQSAYSQTNPDFRIIVVCHEIPLLKKSYDARVEFICVDFPPPFLDGLEGLERSKSCMQDKWKKLAVGMIRVGEIKPDYVMIMDADDLVSQRLSEYVKDYPSLNGWILKQGYRYELSSRWIYVNNHFNCGTNAIVGSKLIHFPKSLAPDEINRCVILSNGHTVIEKKMIELGTPLSPLPFLGAVYLYNHGDNDSSSYVNFKRWKGFRSFLRIMLNARLLTRKIKQEFSMS